LQAWGYTFKTMATWAKRSSTGAKWAFGTGYIFRSAAEFILVGTRGKPKQKVKNVRNLFIAPVREHSRKPDIIFEYAEALWDGPYAEVFSREARHGWDRFGDEPDRFVSNPEIDALIS
jgi:N6-adenosine-specific RNA methylase IME4